MAFAFLIVAVILFVIDFVSQWLPNRPVGAISALGLAFFAASFAVH